MHYIENQNAKDIKALEQRHGPQVQMKRLSWNAFSLRHTLHKCRKVMEKAISDRMKFLQIKRLCCVCLMSGHHYCGSRSVCNLCHKWRLTCLHNERAKEEQEEDRQPIQIQGKKSQVRVKKKIPQSTQYKEYTITTTSNREITDEAKMQTAVKIPVWLSSSTSKCFHTVILDWSKTNIEQVKLSTVTSRATEVNSQRLNNLQVRGFYSWKKISLTPVYMRGFTPGNRTH